MLIDLEMLYLPHLILTIAFKGRKYDSHFIDKEAGAEPLGSKGSLLACLGLHFMNLVFRLHPGSPAAPVLPGPHSSSHQGERCPSLRLDLAMTGPLLPR